MKPGEKEMIIARYNERFKKYGYAPETLGWDKHRHNLRHHILRSLWDVSNKSVLDFGCGFGDLYQYILKNKIHCELKTRSDHRTSEITSSIEYSFAF
jgi:2-polyprenyl-3-methyl-5-hydroxy-6-metoxy-1,4-benzoquinol methylase